MNCTDVEELVKLWEKNPDARIGANPVDSLRSHLDSCPACGKRYGSLSFFIGREGTVQIDQNRKPGFEDSVMRYIWEAEEEKALRFAFPAFLPARFAAAALVLLVFAAGFLYRGTVFPKTGDTVPVHFTFNAPDAESVVLVGSFPGWTAEEGKTMIRTESGQWELTIHLRRSGVYTYNFLVDGTEWVPDPSAAEAVDDGFGGLNSLIRL